MGYVVLNKFAPDELLNLIVAAFGGRFADFFSEATFGDEEWFGTGRAEESGKKETEENEEEVELERPLLASPVKAEHADSFGEEEHPYRKEKPEEVPVVEWFCLAERCYWKFW